MLSYSFSIFSVATATFLICSLSKEQTLKVVKKIFKSAEILKTNPTSFQEEPFLKEKGLSARYLVVSMYKVIYVVKGKTVTITDVFNTNQHPSEMNK